MKNRKLLLIVSLVLALTMSLGGTLAYLQDTDEAVNVMTLGNVDIEQYEMDGTGEDAKPFKQGQPLYPAYYADDNWDWTDSSNTVTGAIDKVVYVKNEGSSDAYVRTLFAIEKGDLTDAEFNANIHLKWNVEIGNPVCEINIQGAKYQVYEYTYTSAIKAGTKAGNTLLGVVMDKTATNDIVAKLGNTYEILVLTQAVQTNNFDTLFSTSGAAGVLDEAFGKPSEKAAEWFGGIYANGGLPTTVASTAAELQAALNAGGNVLLAENITLEEAIEIPQGVTAVLNLNGKTLSSSAYVFENKGNLTIMGDGQLGGLGGIRSTAGSVTINGGTFTGSSNWSQGTYQHILKAENTTVVINAGTFDATIGGTNNAMINVAAGSNITINGGSFKNVEGDIPQFAPYLFTYEGDGKLTINDGDFYGGWRFNGTSATTDIYGGTFEVSYDGQSFHTSSTHVLTVYGGTFSNKLGERIEQHVAAGYTATANTDGTYTVAPIPLEVVSITPDNYSTLTLESGKHYKLTGNFANANVSLVMAVGVENVVFDGSDATNINELIITQNGALIDNATTFVGERSGKVTIKNFNVASQINVFAGKTEVEICNNTAEALSVYAGNCAINIHDNEFDANFETHSIYRDATNVWSTNDYGIQLRIFDYDLWLDNNTVTNAKGHVIGLNGYQATFADIEAENEIHSFTGNKITVNSTTNTNRAAFKVWADHVYAPQDNQNSVNNAAQAFINAVLADGSNTFTIAEGHDHTIFCIYNVNTNK